MGRLSVDLRKVTGQQWLALGMLLLLGVYFAIIAKHAAHAVSGSDGSGYARIAQGLLRGRVRRVATEIEQLGLPLNYAELVFPLAYTPVRQNGVLTTQQAPTYPVGFPLHLAAAAGLSGWQHWPFHVSPLLGAFSVWLIYLVGRQLGLARVYAYASAALLAVNPTALFHSMVPMSDVTAMFWGLVVIWTGIRARQAEGWAWWAGAAFGVGVLVRPTSVLLLVPLVFCLPLRPKVWLRFVAGGLPTAVIFCTYNWAALGHPLLPGYGTGFVQNAFIFSGFFKRFGEYIYHLSVTLTPLLLLGWVGVAIDYRVGWRERALLITWFGAFLILYAFYDLYPDWGYTRFLLPGYPGLILGALFVTRDLLERCLGGRRMLRWAVGALLLVVTVGWAVRFVHQQQLLRFGRGQMIHAEVCRWADRQLPERALVISMHMSGALKFYTQRLILRWDLFVPGVWPDFHRLVLARDYRFYALLLGDEFKQAQEQLPGRWKKLGNLQDVSLWQLEPLDKPLPAVKYGSGFYGWEPAGYTHWQWMSDAGSVQLQNTGLATRLRIEGDMPVDAFERASTLKLFFNGKLLDQVVAHEKSLQREYLITTAQQGSGEWSELRLVVDQVVVPNQINPQSADSRRLGFSLHKLVWEEPAPPAK